MITILEINENIGEIEMFLEPTSFHRDERGNWIVDTFKYYYDGKPNEEIEKYISENHSTICSMMCRYSDFEVLEDDDL